MQRCMGRHPLSAAPEEPLLEVFCPGCGAEPERAPTGKLAFTILPPPSLYGASRGKGRGASTT